MSTRTKNTMVLVWLSVTLFIFAILVSGCTSTVGFHEDKITVKKAIMDGSVEAEMNDKNNYREYKIKAGSRFKLPNFSFFSLNPFK